MLSVIQMFGNEIRARGDPPLREGVLLGKEQGFDPIINCFWYMNPEYALFHSKVDRMVQQYLWYKTSIPDIVDRKIYEKATSGRVRLN